MNTEWVDFFYETFNSGTPTILQTKVDLFEKKRVKYTQVNSPNLTDYVIGITLTPDKGRQEARVELVGQGFDFITYYDCGFGEGFVFSRPIGHIFK